MYRVYAILLADSSKYRAAQTAALLYYLSLLNACNANLINAMEVLLLPTSGSRC